MRERVQQAPAAELLRESKLQKTTHATCPSTFLEPCLPSLKLQVPSLHTSTAVFGLVTSFTSDLPGDVSAGISGGVPPKAVSPPRETRRAHQSKLPRKKSRARNEGRPTIFLHPARLQPRSPLLPLHHGILPTDQRGFRIALVGALVVRRMRLHVRHHRRLVMSRWGVAIQGVGIDVAKVIDFRVLDDGESAVLYVWTGLVVAVAVWRGGSRRRHRCRFSKQVN